MVEYVKYPFKDNPNLSVRFFKIFEDRPDLVGKFCIKNHEEKTYELLSDLGVRYHSDIITPENRLHILGYYEGHGVYTKIVNGVKVQEEEHKKFKGKIMEDKKHESHFWMVFTENGGMPKKKHFSKESALAECKRLAGKTPSQVFYVLKTVDAYVVDLPEPHQVLLGDPIPYI